MRIEMVDARNMTAAKRFELAAELLDLNGAPRPVLDSLMRQSAAAAKGAQCPCPRCGNELRYSEAETTLAIDEMTTERVTERMYTCPVCAFAIEADDVEADRIKRSLHGPDYMKQLITMWQVDLQTSPGGRV